jgi:hypothetical protein
VIKLDTIKRLAELLNISPLSLLGIGVEYYVRAVGYLERIRQIEETGGTDPPGRRQSLLSDDFRRFR